MAFGRDDCGCGGAGGGGDGGGIGTSLVRYCDITTADTVAFAIIVTDEDGTTIEWFDAGLDPIGGQPGNSEVCLAGGGVGADLVRYCDTATGDLVGYAFAMTDGAATTIQWLDAALAPIAGQPADSEVCPECSTLTASGKSCYQQPNEFVEDQGNYTLPLNVGNRFFIATLAPSGTVFQVIAENEGGTGLPALHPPALLIDDSSVVYTFNENLPVGAPITLRVSDVDFGENVVWSIPPDSQTATGNNVITDYTWNDASALNGGVTMTFTGGGIWVVGQFEAEVGDVIPAQEAWTFHDCDGNAIYRDCLTGAILDTPTLVACNQNSPYITAGYLNVCERFDLTQAAASPADFTDAPVGVNRIVVSDNNVASLIRSEIARALLVENEEIRRGLPVTQFVIETSDPVQSYEFSPSALQPGTSSTLELDETLVTAWPANGTFTIARLLYSIFDDCNCRTVEILQEIDPETNETTITDIVDPENYDPDTGIKPTILDGQNLLEFGHLGPFTGPCPDPLQVIELNDLCCDSDLAENNPDIANQRLAWLDGADPALMLDAIGGNPIAGNAGDDVFEVQDKLDPGVSPSFVVPASVGVDAGSNPPTYLPDSLNGLSTLLFDGNNSDRLRLDTNNAPGASFTLFYLLRPTEATPGAFDSCLAVSAGSDGDNLNTTIGAYQLARQGNQTFTMQMRVDNADAVDPIVIFQTPVPNNLDRPSDGISGTTNTRNLSMGFSDIDDFFNQEFHLITVTWNATTNILQGFLDGSLRFAYDLTPMAVTSGVIPSDYFRIFGNRGGNQYLDGQLAEMFFADAAFTNDEIATVNAYLICKWGIDPSLAAGGAGDLVLGEPGVFDTPTPFVRIVRADGEVRFRNKNNGLEYVLPPVPGLAICEAGDDCSGLTASGVVCYNADPGGTDETRMAFVFHDCAGVPIYRDTLTNAVLDTPALIECEGLPVDVQIDKTWTVERCDIQEGVPETVNLFPGANGTPAPYQVQSPSGNVTVDYLGGSDFVSGESFGNQGLVMPGTGTQNVEQGILQISGATSEIVLSIFNLQIGSFVQFDKPPIAWTIADEINPLRFTGNAVAAISTFTFPAGTNLIVVRYSADPGVISVMTQIEAQQDVVIPFQRCFTIDQANNVTHRDLDYEDNDYVVVGEDSVCPDSCVRPIDQVCYINPVFWEARSVVNNFRIQLTVGDVDTTMNVAFPNIVNGFFTENQGLPGMNDPEHPAAISPGSGNALAVYSFGNPLPNNVPITLRLGDIDSETVVWSIVPDSQTAEADGEITAYTWDDASALSGGIQATITAPTLWYVFGPFQTEVNNPVLRAFGSVDCRGIVTYRDAQGNVVAIGDNQVGCGDTKGSELLCDRVGGQAINVDLYPGINSLRSYQVANGGIDVKVSGGGLTGSHSTDDGYVMTVDGSVAIVEVLDTESVYQLVVFDLDVGQQIQFDRIPIIFNGPVNDIGNGTFEGTASDSEARFTFNPKDGPTILQVLDINADSFALIGVDTSLTSVEIPFRRNYDTTPPTDTDIDGNPYVVQGLDGACSCGCQDGPAVSVPTVLTSRIFELNTGETWQGAVDVPTNVRLVEFGYSVLVGVADNGVTDSQANSVANLPTGFSERFKADEDGYILPYQVIDAGTNGRIIVSATWEA